MWTSTYTGTLRKGGCQLSNGSLLRRVQKYCLLLFFPKLPDPRCGWSSQDTSWCCPDTNFVSYSKHIGCLLDTMRHLIVYCMPKVCITGPKMCVWASFSQKDGWDQGQTRRRRKKKQTILFVVSAIRMHCWFVGSWLRPFSHHI